MGSKVAVPQVSAIDYIKDDDLIVEHKKMSSNIIAAAKKPNVNLQITKIIICFNKSNIY